MMQAMRSLVLACFLVACAKPPPVPPKRPNDELIVGAFERRPPDGTTAMRFNADGTFVQAKDRSQLDDEPPAASGHYRIEGDLLTFTNEEGLCADASASKVGTYRVVVSKVGIRFAKEGNDACESRAKIDGQTWWRIKPAELRASH
jgi:hypothetical protein